MGEAKVRTSRLMEFTIFANDMGAPEFGKLFIESEAEGRFQATIPYDSRAASNSAWRRVACPSGIEYSFGSSL
jgi:hypothetical protein